MDISSKSAKISAHFEIPLVAELEIGSSCLVGLEGQVASVSDESNEDGTQSRVWKIKASKGQISGKDGVITTLKDKTRKSVALRGMITHVWGKDYETVMNCLLANGEELNAWVEKHL